MKAALRAVGAVEKTAATVAAAIMFAVMVIGTVDVFLRYAFNAPLTWDHDVMTLYLLPALFYFSVSYTFAQNGHIGVDVLQYRMSRVARRICQIVIGIGGALVFALIAVLGAQRTIAAHANGLVQGGIIPWPVWASYVFVPIGAGLIAVRLVLHAIAHGVWLVTGAELLELPPLAGSSEAPVRFE